MSRFSSSFLNSAYQSSGSISNASQDPTSIIIKQEPIEMDLVESTSFNTNTPPSTNLIAAAPAPAPATSAGTPTPSTTLAATPTPTPFPSNSSNNVPMASTSAKPVKRKSSSLEPTKPKKKSASVKVENNTNSNNVSVDNSLLIDDSNSSQSQANGGAAGHRPVTSCTHCRQHKIKCNASENFPDPCTRCQRMELKCEIDPQFRPKKGSQIQSLKNDVDELRSKIEFLTRNESLIVQALQTSGSNIASNNNGITNNDSNQSPLNTNETSISNGTNGNNINGANNNNIHKDSIPFVAKTFLQKDSNLITSTKISPSPMATPGPNGHPMDSNPMQTNPAQAVDQHYTVPIEAKQVPEANMSPMTSANPTSIVIPKTPITEFNLGDVKISLEKAAELHQRFVNNYLPYLPIMVSNNCVELYQQSQLLFWTVMLTACLSDPDPSLYMPLSSLIKQLAIETYWIRTPRSTHIVQALLILGTWPLPNQKVLDDCSYRFIGLAKNLALQLGLHRGKFISEFSRTQVSLPDAEKWRTRTWIAVFFSEQFWSSDLGLPPSLQTDFLLESARIDYSLPKNFRCLISLSIFQAKLVSVMGLSVTSPDGLMEPKNRAGALAILERELDRLAFKLQIDDVIVETYFLYVQLTVCCFAFLPETPSEDQTKYVTQAYLSATRIVTIMSKLSETRQLTEYPIYVRHSVTMAVLVLFRLHLTPYLLPKYIDSARQSIVTVHRLFRNMLASWKDVENDISRTATVLEKLNFVIITNPELFTEPEGIIVRMRSHLTGSLFYDLVWCIHEARRRLIAQANNNKDQDGNGQVQSTNNTDPSSLSKSKPLPLPFYNQITKDDFTAITTTTPNGTTVTTLVPTDQALLNANNSAAAAGLSKATEINGIPLAMLEATGSLPATMINQQGQLGKARKNQPKSAKTAKPKTTPSKSKSRKTSDVVSSQSQIPQQQAQQQLQQQQQNSSNGNGLSQDPSAQGQGMGTAAGSSLPIMMERNKSTTSIAAGVNGMVPPPLFPSRQNSTRFNQQPQQQQLQGQQQQQQQQQQIQQQIPQQQQKFVGQSPMVQQFSQIAQPSNFAANGFPASESPSNSGTGRSNTANTEDSVGHSPASFDPNMTPDLNSQLISSDQRFIDSIFQQQNAANWIENGDDFLGWFDTNMAPEF